MTQGMLGSRRGRTSTLSTCAQCRFGGMGCQAERSSYHALRPISPVMLLINRCSPVLSCRRDAPAYRVSWDLASLSP